MSRGKITLQNTKGRKMRRWDPIPFFLQIEPHGFKREKNDGGTISNNIKLIKFLNGTRTRIHLNLYVKQFSVHWLTGVHRIWSEHLRVVTSIHYSTGN